MCVLYLVTLTSAPQATVDDIVNVSSNARVSFTCAVNGYSGVVRDPRLCIRSDHGNSCSSLVSWNKQVAIGTFEIEEITRDLNNSEVYCRVTDEYQHDFLSHPLHISVQGKNV